MRCRAHELWGYRQYIEELSPFATQQSIKGAEFEKVLVIIDDEEGRMNAFSYGKYLGVTDLSPTDQRNIGQVRTRSLTEPDGSFTYVAHALDGTCA